MIWGYHYFWKHSYFPYCAIQRFMFFSSSTSVEWKIVWFVPCPGISNHCGWSKKRNDFRHSCASCRVRSQIFLRLESGLESHRENGGTLGLVSQNGWFISWKSQFFKGWFGGFKTTIFGSTPISTGKYWNVEELGDTLPETNIGTGPENWWLKNYIPFGIPFFQVLCQFQGGYFGYH